MIPWNTLYLLSFEMQYRFSNGRLFIEEVTPTGPHACARSYKLTWAHLYRCPDVASAATSCACSILHTRANRDDGWYATSRVLILRIICSRHLQVFTRDERGGAIVYFFTSAGNECWTHYIEYLTENKRCSIQVQRLKLVTNPQMHLLPCVKASRDHVDVDTSLTMGIWQKLQRPLEK